jgi:hypothetical protein
MPCVVSGRFPVRVISVYLPPLPVCQVHKHPRGAGLEYRLPPTTSGFEGLGFPVPPPHHKVVTGVYSSAPSCVSFHAAIGDASFAGYDPANRRLDIPASAGQRAGHAVPAPGGRENACESRLLICPITRGKRPLIGPVTYLMRPWTYNIFGQFARCPRLNSFGISGRIYGWSGRLRGPERPPHD